MEKQYIIINGEQKEMPESRLLRDVISLYCEGIEDGMYLAKINGKVIHSLVDGNDTVVEPNDNIEAFSLVVGG